jgi:hypothetical protein
LRTRGIGWHKPSVQPSSSEDVRERYGVQEKVLKCYQYFEEFLVLALLALLMIVILYATLGFLVLIVMELIERLRTQEIHITLPLLHEVFTGLLMFQIGL